MIVMAVAPVVLDRDLGVIKATMTANLVVGDLDEAKALWKSLTNTAFSMKGEFEPQQHVSYVAGRPVVAIGSVEILQG